MRYEGPGFYGLNPPLWVSGATIARGQWVTSPADDEIYQRITAAGGGTTDPADDITNYVARSYVRTAALPATAYVGYLTAFHNQVSVSPAEIALNARTLVLSITGRGSLGALQFKKGAGGSLRIEIICDGRSVYDQTRSTVATTHSFVAVGVLSSIESTGCLSEILGPIPEPMQFRRSLQVFVTPTVSSGTSAPTLAYIVRSEA